MDHSRSRARCAPIDRRDRAGRAVVATTALAERRDYELDNHQLLDENGRTATPNCRVRRTTSTDGWTVIANSRIAIADRAAVHGLDHPSGLAEDTTGNVYVADETLHLVLKLAVGSSALTVLPFTNLGAPSDVAVDSTGTLDVTDQENDRVLTLPPDSSTPTVLPFTSLDRPDSVAADTTSNLYVSNVYNNQVLKLTGGWGHIGTKQGDWRWDPRQRS